MPDEVNIRVTGGAGQGIHTVGTLLCRMAVSAGHHFHLTQDYMSRIRGGRNSQTVRIGVEPVRAGRETAEILLAVNPDQLPQVLPGVTPGGFAIADRPDAVPGTIRAPLKELAVAAGSPILVNVAGTGAIAFALGYPKDHADRVFEEQFRGEFREKNRSAFHLGWEWAEANFPPDESTRFRLPPGRFSPRLVMSGNEALALGAIAGGCTFGCGYPMTPGTGILSVLADEGGKTGLLFEQAEDEIAALNMAIGAAYTGARSLVATSGGGFALMAEALSLAGMMETPVVVALGMRPGPATGMPTRTAQGDLEFVLSAGHGEFPRLVLSPGSVEEAFELAQHAMDAAERFQVPVILLTDQHLADTVVDIDPEKIAFQPVRRHLARGGKVPRTPEGKYLRYAVTESGVSPMAIPGQPGITVVAGSDEHTEDGHLTEDHGVRAEMVRKRLRKGESLARETIPPLFSGPPAGDLLLIGFGSTKEAIAEARGILAAGGKRAGSVHLRQVCPFPAREIAGILPRYRVCLTAEHNATGQLARLIRRETGLSVDGSILRYDGLPFTPREIAEEAGSRT